MLLGNTHFCLDTIVYFVISTYRVTYILSTYSLYLLGTVPIGINIYFLPANQTKSRHINSFPLIEKLQLAINKLATRCGRTNKHT